jgi:hypothetical protein
MEFIMKVSSVIILGIAILVSSGASFAHTHQAAALKSQAQADSATEAAPGHFRTSPDDDTVIVDLPFSFLELDPALAEYLSLTSRQIRAIQHLISRQRRELEPLRAELQVIHEKLLAAAERVQSTEIEVLAATEARILTKLIIKSSRILARLYDLLTPAQQKKLEDLNVVLKER